MRRLGCGCIQTIIIIAVVIVGVIIIKGCI